MARFELVKLLGQGGMGRVHLAWDPALSRYVAIKLIRDPNRERRARFEREARTVAGLNHPNIATLYDFGTSEGQPFIVSEYVDGQTLADVDKPMPWRDAWALGTAIARGLAAAHRKGVLHRDIKPSNVLIPRDDESAHTVQPKLVDFGLAKFLRANAQVSRQLVSGPELAGPTPAVAHDLEALQPSRGHDGTGIIAGTTITRDGAVLGTPSYMAPELWDGERATRASDVYSLGVLLYELCTGRLPLEEDSLAELINIFVADAAVPLTDVAPDVDAHFAALIDRCLARDPGERPESAEALWRELESLTPRERRFSLPHGTPYPGLRRFESELRGVFFGRDVDVRALVERLRHAPIVLVVGASGVGKSSLVRAGLLPVLEDEGLDDERSWRTCTMTPDAAPMTTLLTLLAEHLGEGVTAEVLAEEIATDISVLSDRLRARHGRTSGLVIFIDQLEELVTLSDCEGAKRFAEMIHDLSRSLVSLRVVATVRGDKLTDVVALTELGASDPNSLYLLRALREDGLRQAIVEPAAMHGVTFESEILVERLVRAASAGPGSLPLLQFALLQLWLSRDTHGNTLTLRALNDMGGVEGALARHADGVWSSLPPASQRAARRVLLHLVSDQRNRIRKPADTLLVDGDMARAADALVRARLLTVSGSSPAMYEIAHESLIDHWPRLKDWLDEENEFLVMRERISFAESEWVRADRDPEMLWKKGQLMAADALLTNELAARHQDFLVASRRQVRRQRWLRRGLVAAPVLAIVVVYAAMSYTEAAERRRDVDVHMSQARAVFQDARSKHAEYTALVQSVDRCLARRPQTECADERAVALELAVTVDRMFNRVWLGLQRALMRDPERSDVKRLLAELYFERAVLAEERGLHDDFETGMMMLASVDEDGMWQRRWTEPRRVDVTTSPPGFAVRIERQVRESDGRFSRVVVDERAVTPTTRWLEPGSYVIDIRGSDGYADMRYPFTIASGDPDAQNIELAMPRSTEVPDGLVYVPPGEFYLGHGRDQRQEDERRWLFTVPRHERHAPGFFIARHETTYDQWIRFVEALPAQEREARLPRAREESSDMQVELAQDEAGWRLDYRPSPHDPGETIIEHMARDVIRYPGRERIAVQQWKKLPVTGISGHDVVAYTAWLDRTGQVPGARPCREDEWERAARGADERVFSHGDRLRPQDANYDESHGRVSGSFGFDEVGSHPLSTSPFGLQDMVGNAREMTVSVLDEGKLVLRSGSYYRTWRTNMVVNRDLMEWGQRRAYAGFRVCADAPLRLR